MSPRKGGDVPDHVTKEDIAAKLAEIRGDVEETAQGARPTLTLVAVGVGVAVIVAVFLLGRSRGRRKSTVVEIRRR
ncbi:MAG TPA: hypothetical protein VKU91_07705 [Acidimicrobiales bacterium]|nr:hypothetical protein [Acidimicrobiales bacterium]